MSCVYCAQSVPLVVNWSGKEIDQETAKVIMYTDRKVLGTDILLFFYHLVWQQENLTCPTLSGLCWMPLRWPRMPHKILTSFKMIEIAHLGPIFLHDNQTKYSCWTEAQWQPQRPLIKFAPPISSWSLTVFWMEGGKSTKCSGRLPEWHEARQDLMQGVINSLVNFLSKIFSSACMPRWHWEKMEGLKRDLGPH